jgi:hypothetical protein
MPLGATVVQGREDTMDRAPMVDAFSIWIRVLSQ